MLEIDGSIGGGSVVRIALGLSTLVKKPIRIFNVRVNRDNPGLKHQHLRGCRAMVDLTDGRIKGDELGSKEIEFYPGEVYNDKVEMEIPTAGSIGLALQPLLIGCLGSDGKIKVSVKGGGTAGKWAPPVRYLKYVTAPILDRIGYEISIDVLKDGFYPKGGARVKVEFIPPKEEKQLNLTNKGDFLRVRGISIASKDLKHAEVAKRQADKAEELLSEHLDDVSIRYKYRDTLSTGSVVVLYAKYGKTVIGGDAIGERGKPSEKVASEAVRSLLRNREGAVDRYAGDQLIPFLALLGGELRVPKITDHIKTNIKVVEQFFPIELEVENRVISRWKKR